MAATNRGTKLEQAVESLERTEEALERNRGTITEQDWADAVERAKCRVLELDSSERAPR